MSDPTYSDLPTLATDLREVLKKKAHNKPAKSPFAVLYAFNGTGKTRLSAAFKDLGKNINEDGETVSRDTLYFNAFTEDLFSWDNDLENDHERVLKINHDSQFFAGLSEMEMDNRIRPLLRRYTEFDFFIDYDEWEILFYRERDANGDPVAIKISRGEENIFIWCFFLAILQLALDGAEAYGWVEYVFIDDPVSSLDEHNAIVVGNHLVELYQEAQRPIRTVVSTHHTLFFNVLHYELKSHLGGAAQYILKQDRKSGAYRLAEQKGDTPQFYHVAALSEIWELAQNGSVKTYHFNVLRSILEKTALFHGYQHFSRCIRGEADDADGRLHQRFVDLLSHGKYEMYEPTEMGDDTQDAFRAILQRFIERHPFNPDLLPSATEDDETL